MSQIRHIDKAVHAHAILNMVQAVIASPNGLLVANNIAQEKGIRIEEAMILLGESFAMFALRNIESADVVSLPAGCGASDAITLYISGLDVEGRVELEDRMQEGELASNAIALLQNEPGFWTPDAPNPEDAPFPGSGANDGPERLNDLIKAAAYVMAEIGRLERKQRREDEYAANAVHRGAAVMPGSDDAVEQAVEAAADKAQTQH